MKKLAIKTSLWVSGLMPAVALAADDEIFVPGEDTELPQIPSQVTSFGDLIGTIVVIGQWMFGILMALGVVFIIYAGLRYLMAQGDPERVEGAKRLLIYAIVGMVVGVLAGGIAQLVQQFAQGL